MRYAIVSDVHANTSALRHVLADAAVHGVQQVICLGDVVGYGPLPRETVALLRRSAALVLAGNHDDAVSGRQGTALFTDLAGESVRRHRKALPSEALDWLKTLPYTGALEGAVAAHGDFTNPSAFNYIETEKDAARSFAATDASLMFVGHTHTPCLFLVGRSGTVYRTGPQDFTLEDGKRYIVNPGSVGYPRDRDGTCFSSYVLYDSTERTVCYRFLPFDVSSVMQRGPRPHRRTLGLLAAGLAVALTVCGAAFFVTRPTNRPPTVVPAEQAAEPDVTMARKSLTLTRGLRTVRANLKIKGAPVRLHLEFKNPTGDVVGEYDEIVRRSSAKPFPIPKGAISAHFTVLRKSAQEATVTSLDPSAQ